MRFDRKSLSLTLALLLALRTFVPVGYMLQLPVTGTGAGFGLILCPTQNAGLELSLFAPLAAQPQHGHHPTHDHGAPGSAGDGIIETGSDCRVWLTSASLAFESTPVVSLPPSAASDGIISRTYRFLVQRRGSDALARAPPRIT